MKRFCKQDVANSGFRAVILSHLRQTFRSRRDIGVSGVFCDYKNQKIQSPANLIASIWRQLAYDSVPSQSVIDIYEENFQKGTQPSMQEMVRILRAEVLAYSKVLIVIDGLDECIQPTSLSLLNELSIIPNANILITSRFPPMDTSPPCSFVCLGIASTEEDIRSYIYARVHSDPALLQYSKTFPGLMKELQDKIMERAEGM
jgi:hypothetical protein